MWYTYVWYCGFCFQNFWSIDTFVFNFSKNISSKRHLWSPLTYLSVHATMHENGQQGHDGHEKKVAYEACVDLAKTFLFTWSSMWACGRPYGVCRHCGPTVINLAWLLLNSTQQPLASMSIFFRSSVKIVDQVIADMTMEHIFSTSSIRSLLVPLVFMNPSFTVHPPDYSLVVVSNVYCLPFRLLTPGCLHFGGLDCQLIRHSGVHMLNCSRPIL